MKYLIIPVAILAFASCSSDTTEITSVTAQERTIQVTGSADMEVTPDQIEFRIGIEEDNQNSLDKIERELRKQLGELNITSDKIQTYGVGNYWNWKYDDRRLSKDFIIQLSNMDEIDLILANIDMNGIGYMSLGELSHQNIHEYRKEVKIEALKQAKEKATYMLEAMDQELGELITIKELGDGYNWWWGGQSLSNASIYPSRGSQSGNNNPRNISLRYEVEVTFQIL
ncbi:MAG: SIMPL domain-containing protein [Crocinitomicaceae bacterium]|nr:SIMPL domain-containing protein [Crocinitomicaceae bacterium]